MLETVRGPRDPKALSEVGLGELSEEIGAFLVHAVAGTGGHLGSDPGVVEPTVALHRVFESPADRIPWDTGHRSSGSSRTPNAPRYSPTSASPRSGSPAGSVRTWPSHRDEEGTE